MTNFAIEFWAKAFTTPYQAYPRTMFGRSNYNLGGFDFCFQNGYGPSFYTFASVRNDAGKMVYYRINHVNQDGCNAFLPVDEWIHFGIAVNIALPSGEKIKIFKNGVRQVTEVYADDADYSSDILQTPTLLLAPAWWDNGGALSAMDSLKIYDYAKTDFSLDF